MHTQCPKCHSLIALEARDRLPPWCPKCGADIKPNEAIPVTVQAVGGFGAAVEPDGSDEPDVVTAVTGGGRKGWLKGASAPPEIEPPAAALLPVPPVSPHEESKFGVTNAIGVILLLIAGVMAGDTWTFIKNGRETTGVVAAWPPCIEYTVNGKTYTGPQGTYEVGETVPIVYKVGNPENMRRGAPGSLYFGAAMVGSIGLGLLFITQFVRSAMAADRERERMRERVTTKLA